MKVDDTAQMMSRNASSEALKLLEGTDLVPADFTDDEWAEVEEEARMIRENIPFLDGVAHNLFLKVRERKDQV